MARRCLVIGLALTLLLAVARRWIALPEPQERFQGQVTRVLPTVGGGVMLRVGKRMVMLSPQLGLVGPFVAGDQVEVEGYERTWRGRKFFMPLTRAHVRKQEARSVSVAEAMALPSGQRVHLQAVPDSVELFQSRAGKTHLRFVLGPERCPAIMFEGSYGPAEVELVRSGGILELQAETDRYRGKPSLIVRRVSR